MNNVKMLTSSNILFLPAFEKTYAGHQLKTFLSFLIGRGAGPALRFSFLDPEGLLLPQLTLKENIYLDSIPCSLTDSKEAQFQHLMEQTGNTHLIHFYKSIPLLDEFPDKVDDQTRKMAALVKTLLQKSDYLLLDHPEKYLEQKNTELFIKALELYATSTNKTIILSSPNIKMWVPYVNKIIHRKVDKSFETRPVNYLTLIKTPQKKVSHDLGHLKFNNFSLPKTAENLKKAA